jgi:sulfoxide reductase heme-binding subunit YedZ
MSAADPATGWLWYLARGSGLVLLGALTVNVILGIAIQGGWHPSGWPRFAVQAIHRNLAILAVLLLGVHVLTIELDPFVPVGWWALIVPFLSPYRPLWLGLGTLSLDIFVLVIATSLLRAHMGAKSWRVVHWLVYLSWPLAVLHSLGTGTDAHLAPAFGYEIACVAAVALALMVRIGRAASLDHQSRIALILATASVPVWITAWAASGPLQAGWAKASGSPAARAVSASGTGEAEQPAVDSALWLRSPAGAAPMETQGTVGAPEPDPGPPGAWGRRIIRSRP